MRTFVCIDDTDNLETRGTGALAALMIEPSGYTLYLSQ
jgi:hypothetical protein